MGEGGGNYARGGVIAGFYSIICILKIEVVRYLRWPTKKGHSIISFFELEFCHLLSSNLYFYKHVFFNFAFFFEFATCLFNVKFANLFFQLKKIQVCKSTNLKK